MSNLAGAPFEDRGALFGAAYRVLNDDVGLADNVTTRERLAEVRARVNAILDWSNGQPPDVSAAYARAGADWLQRATISMENNERAQMMAAAYESIPRPPARP